jgi:hypothetical protein
VVIGALLSGGRKMIWNRWFAAGVVIAVAFEVPDLWWQAQHGWATIAMTEALNRENGGVANIFSWLAGQLVMTVFFLAGVSVIGQAAKRTLLRAVLGTRRPLSQGTQSGLICATGLRGGCGHLVWARALRPYRWRPPGVTWATPPAGRPPD